VQLRSYLVFVIAGRIVEVTEIVDPGKVFVIVIVLWIVVKAILVKVNVIVLVDIVILVDAAARGWKGRSLLGMVG